MGDVDIIIVKLKYHNYHDYCYNCILTENCVKLPANMSKHGKMNHDNSQVSQYCINIVLLLAVKTTQY